MIISSLFPTCFPIYWIVIKLFSSSLPVQIWPPNGGGSKSCRQQDEDPLRSSAAQTPRPGNRWHTQCGASRGETRWVTITSQIKTIICSKTLGLPKWPPPHWAGSSSPLRLQAASHQPTWCWASVSSWRAKKSHLHLKTQEEHIMLESEFEAERKTNVWFIRYFLDWTVLFDADTVVLVPFCRDQWTSPWSHPHNDPLFAFGNSLNGLSISP